jgi:hypothetical protein
VASRWCTWEGPGAVRAQEQRRERRGRGASGGQHGVQRGHAVRVRARRRKAAGAWRGGVRARGVRAGQSARARRRWGRPGVGARAFAREEGGVARKPEGGQGRGSRPARPGRPSGVRARGRGEKKERGRRESKKKKREGDRVGADRGKVVVRGRQTAARCGMGQRSSSVSVVRMAGKNGEG